MITLVINLSRKIKKNRRARGGQNYRLPITLTATLGFAGSLQIGTPAQNFSSVLFDGAANSYQITGSGCVGCNTPSTLASFNGAASSTYQPTTTTSSVQYGGTGLSNTLLVNDTVVFVSDGSTSNLVIPNFQFQVVTSGAQLKGVSGDFGFSHNNNTLIPQLFNAGSIPLQQYTNYYNPSTSSGYIYIGGVDPKVSSTFYSFPVFSLSNKAWNLQFLAVNSVAAAPSTQINFDFGAGVYQLPSYYQTNAFYTSISTNSNCTISNGVFGCQCSSIASMLPLSYTLQGSSGPVTLTIPAAQYATYESSIQFCATSIQFVNTGSAPGTSSTSSMTMRLSANWQQYFVMNFDYTNQVMNIAATSSSSISTAVPTYVTLSSYADLPTKK